MRVRYTEYVLRGLRDHWLSCGRSDLKATAKRAYDKKVAMRGTIVDTDYNKVTVLWDDGTTSICLSYMVMLTK